MKVTESGIKGVFIIEPDVYEDDRGFFMETFHNERYRKLLGINLDFVQDNISRSSKNVLRGMHFQKNYPQGKIVKASRGEILDVVVDLRKGSPTYGTWESFRLSEKNKLQVWIPPGFAHGFLVMSDSADFEYKCTEYYHPEDELCLMWNDPEVAIDWTINEPIVTGKDKKGLSLKDL
ncbi:MAG: dTDP-4-dehydrorhamnose 3,5-epimerase [Actinobacteria bacterium]|nr:dTDP-4-dehydrorhamnose 3,5-epimerase [Actinomycetota bacterium]